MMEDAPAPAKRARVDVEGGGAARREDARLWSQVDDAVRSLVVALVLGQQMDKAAPPGADADAGDGGGGAG
eukprot:CAMPEP_0203828182 /NCGR_PEP_ID=MMETSP0115-20131106/60676_1 /ASSEMBLY_ACC=CAM_ASM_000227 /TAXON_ID=33651 /ORGANISM="Bicosoecid sp, Strain ms1" /LENGTH=70 /DNA_ID=CAMNT_0050737239 /DNA_START=1 /DNA_END=210 /DNA_ORIENTATION=-